MYTDRYDTLIFEVSSLKFIANNTLFIELYDYNILDNLLNNVP